MNSAATSVRRRIAATLSALALGVTGIATALPAAAAPDPDVRGEATVSDATFTWGVKQSFRNYLSSPIAHGTVTTLGTTTQNPSTEQFIWPGGAGTISTDGTSGSIGFGAGNVPLCCLSSGEDGFWLLVEAAVSDHGVHDG